MLFHSESPVLLEAQHNCLIKKSTLKIICFLKTMEGNTVICASRVLLIIWRWEKKNLHLYNNIFFNAHIFARQNWKPLGSLATRKHRMRMKHLLQTESTFYMAAWPCLYCWFQSQSYYTQKAMKPTGFIECNFKYVRKYNPRWALSAPLTLVVL